MFTTTTWDGGKGTKRRALTYMCICRSEFILVHQSLSVRINLTPPPRALYLAKQYNGKEEEAAGSGRRGQRRILSPSKNSGSHKESRETADSDFRAS